MLDLTGIVGLTGGTVAEFGGAALIVKSGTLSVPQRSWSHADYRYHSYILNTINKTEILLLLKQDLCHSRSELENSLTMKIKCFYFHRQVLHIS